MKIGDLVKPSSQWEGHKYHDEEDFGVGVVIERVEDPPFGRPQSHIMWSTEDAYNSWEYDYELEVINEGR